jgi:hypothetical protein
MTHQLRHSTLFFLLSGLGLLTILLLAVHAASASGTAGAARAEQLRLARSLQLTDLCIFTEARYTRHPAMADNHAPFQEHPAALEHFPSGALLLPPGRQVRTP